MEFIDKQMVGLTLEEKRTFQPYFIGSIIALVKYSTDGKIDVEAIKKAAFDSREYALDQKNNPLRKQ